MSLNPDRVTYSTFTQSAPEVYTALSSLGKAVSKLGIDPMLIELVKIRVSQINGCAFCLQYHLDSARKLSIPSAKLDLLATWHDAGVFSPKEMAALAWAEALTKLNDNAVLDEVWENLQGHFTQIEATFLTCAISHINAWNRLGVGFRFAPNVQVSAS